MTLAAAANVIANGGATPPLFTVAYNVALTPDENQQLAAVAAVLTRLLAEVASLPVRVLLLDAELPDLPEIRVAGSSPERLHLTRLSTFSATDLPFTEEAFDGVVALDVLPKLSAADRPRFLAECLRIARHGVVWTCAAGPADPSAAARELVEPHLEEIIGSLEQLDYPYAVFEGSSRADGRTPRQRVYVAARSFEAVAGLEAPPGMENRPATKVGRSARGEARRLRRRLHRREATARVARRHRAVLGAFVMALQRSWVWRLLASIWAVPALLPKGGIDESSLIAQQHLKHVARGGYWQSTGPRPRFIVPYCFSKGWIRISFTIESHVPTALTIYADFGNGFSKDTRIEQLPVGRVAERDCFVYLDKPVRALRIDPYRGRGYFRFHRLCIKTVPALFIAAKAIVGKLSLVYTYGYTWAALRHGLGLLLSGQISTFGKKLTKGLKGSAIHAPPAYDPELAYDQWRRRQALTEGDRHQLHAEAESMSDKPLISVLMVVDGGPESELREAIESVLGQVYIHWELCIVDGSAGARPMCDVIEQCCRRDARIRMIPAQGPRDGPLVNSALEAARGTYVALLNAADRLAEHSLQSMARAIVADPTLDFLYSDEDRIDSSGRHVEPFFKPDWSPEYLLGFPYACRFAIHRTEFVRELGGWRNIMGSVHEYDLVLRMAARTSRVKHIADILYHKRLPKELATSCDPDAGAAARLALSHHLIETRRSGSIELGLVQGTTRVRFSVVGSPLVSIIIPTAAARKTIAGREQTLITRCVRGIRQLSTWPNYEILVVGDEDMPDAARAELTGLGGRVVSFRGPFNFSAKINFGASQAVGQQLLMLNDDTEVISPDWLESMIEFAQQDDIGAVGAMLLLPTGRLQHAGINLLAGQPVHAFPGCPHDHPGHGYGNLVPHNCCAVTGACLMTRSQVFHELGGLDTAFPLAYNDIDYCFRLQSTGRRVVFTPHARLYHHEATTRGGESGAGRDLFHARWAEVYSRDPYYNLNLSPVYPDYRIDPDAPKASLFG